MSSAMLQRPMSYAERDAVLYATTGKLDKLAALLAKEVDVDATDDQGNSLLMIAAWSGKRDVVDDLLRRGANINHRNRFGTTAYILAKGAGHTDIAGLLETGSNLDVGYDVKKLLEIRPSSEALFSLYDAIRGEGHRHLRRPEKLLLAAADLYTQANNDGLLMVERCGYWIVPASRELFSQVGCDTIAIWLEKAQSILDDALANGSAKADPTSGSAMFLHLDDEPRNRLEELDHSSPIANLGPIEDDTLVEAILRFVRTHISDFR